MTSLDTVMSTYLTSEKSQSLENFKIFRTKVEKQLGKEIKVNRSYWRGEYYGKYDESGKNKGPFARTWHNNTIYHTWNPKKNAVAERRNKTFINMIRTMMCAFGLPNFLSGEALKTANYLRKRTASKVSKIPFEL